MGDDFTVPASPVTLNWADSDSASKSFNITVKADVLTEGDEAINLALQNATVGVAIGAQSTAVATIIDRPPMPGTLAFSAATYSQTEPASGTILKTITVNRTGGSTGVASVDAIITGGSATVSDDFTVPASPVTLNWADGDSASKSFDITVKADALTEGDETINLALQNVTVGVTIGTQSTTVTTIIDRPPPPGTLAFNAAAYSQTEPTSGTILKTITVNRTGGSAGPASVRVTVTGGTAKNPDDYTLTTPVMLNWEANDSTAKTFDIAVKADAIFESPDTINLALGNATGATLGTQANATVIISDGTSLIPLAPFSGSYNGLFTPSTEPLLHSGLVNIKVTPKGTFTGKATLGGVALPIRGSFNAASGAASFGKTLTSSVELVKKAKPVNISLGFLSLNLDITGGDKVTGTLKDQVGTTTLGTIPHADRALYTSKKIPVAPLRNVPTTILNPAKEKGKYTIIFAANAAPNNNVAKNGFPQGAGFGLVTVSPVGVVKIIGKLADGSSFTFSNALSKNNEWPVFVQLYKKGGFISGSVAFDDTQTQTDAACAGMSWFKPDTTGFKVKDKLYPTGWRNGITTDLIASKYLVPTKPTTKNPTPPNPNTVLGLSVPGAPSTTTANIFITTADGGLPTNTSNDASLSAASKATVLAATTGSSGATMLKNTFVSAKGTMSGSFIHPGTNKVVKFSGVAYQKTNTASGYFLYLPPSLLGAPAESGAVGVAKK